MATGDVVQFGFGSMVGGFNTNLGARVSRCIRANRNRVDLLGIDVSWIAGAAVVVPVNGEVSVSAIVAVWRSTVPLDVAPGFGFPFFASFGNGLLQLPPGLELLYSSNATAIQHDNGVGAASRYPTRLSLCSVRFPDATIFARQSQELWVSVTQPSSDGGDIWNGGPGAVFLSAIGIDYGDFDPSATEQSQFRSLPRFGVGNNG